MITMSDEEQKGLTGFFSRFGSAKKQTVSEEEIKDIVADNDELADDEKRMIHDSSTWETCRCMKSCSRAST